MALHRDTCKTAEHYTPKCWCRLAHQVLGRIDLDPASCPTANELVEAEQYYTRHMNGLMLPWFGCVYCNPPGDRHGILVPQFWAKAVEHATSGGVVLWAGFSLDQLSRLQPSPTDYAFVIVRKRIEWVPGEFSVQLGLPGIAKDDSVSNGKNPTKHNYFALLGGDRGQKLRFARLFGPTGAYREAARRAA